MWKRFRQGKRGTERVGERKQRRNGKQNSETKLNKEIACRISYTVLCALLCFAVLCSKWTEKSCHRVKLKLLFVRTFSSLDFGLFSVCLTLFSANRIENITLYTVHVCVRVHYSKKQKTGQIKRKCNGNGRKRIKIYRSRKKKNCIYIRRKWLVLMWKFVLNDIYRVCVDRVIYPYRACKHISVGKHSRLRFLSIFFRFRFHFHFHFPFCTCTFIATTFPLLLSSTTTTFIRSKRKWISISNAEESLWTSWKC